MVQWLGHLFYTEKVVGSIPTENIDPIVLMVNTLDCLSRASGSNPDRIVIYFALCNKEIWRNGSVVSLGLTGPGSIPGISLFSNNVMVTYPVVSRRSLVRFRLEKDSIAQLVQSA